jgi:hypothetical protein
MRKEPGSAFGQMEHMCGHLRHKYSVAVNQVMLIHTTLYLFLQVLPPLYFGALHIGYIAYVEIRVFTYKYM